MSGQVGEFKDILRGCEYFYALSQNYVVVAHFLIRIIWRIVVPRLRSVASNGTVITVMRECRYLREGIRQFVVS